MNNTVILNKDASTWPRIKKYWEERGISTSDMAGWDNWYYGVINGRFDVYSIEHVKDANAVIIELPEELNKYSEKPILRKAYEIIGRLKAENLKRAGFPDSDITTYLQADKDLKEIESHLNK